MRTKTDATAKDFYKHYSKDLKGDLSQAEVRNSLDLIFKKIVDRLIYKAYIYEIPYRMGAIFIARKKITYNKENPSKYFPIDYKATKDLWESNEEARLKRTKIRHLNKNTNGYIMRITYIKGYALYKNKTMYSFTPAKYTFRRKLAAAIKEHGNKLNFYEHYNKL